MCVSFLLPVLLLTAVPTPPPLLRFEYRADPLANLTYHLNCLAGAVTCSEDSFREVWNTLGWTPQDDQQLAAWRALTERVRAFTEFSEQLPEPLPYPTNNAAAFDQMGKFQLAGYVARDVEDYRRLLGMLLIPADVQRAVDVVNHFSPRFQAWWDAGARRGAEGFAAGFARLMEERALVPFCERVARFYGAELPPGTSVRFQAIWRPRTAAERASGSVHTNATVVENVSPVEVLDNEQPADRMDVVLHELFHFFFWSRPLQEHARQMRAFLDSPDPDALGLYMILDEAVAAALGNGLVAERVRGKDVVAKELQGPRSLYSDPFIDAVGRALIRPLDQALAGNGVMDAAFVTQYLALARQALGERVHSPLLLLKARGIVYFDSAHKPLVQRFKRSFRGVVTHAQSADSTWALESQSQLSGVVMLTADHLPDLAGHSAVVPAAARQDLETLLKTHAGGAYGIRRSNHADVYVLVARDSAALQAVAEQFVKQPARFTGVGFTVEGK